MPGIIVGVDGSNHSRYALGRAMHEAATHQLPLTVMSINPPPARPATSIFWGLHNLPENSYDPELARRAVQDFVDEVASETDEALPEIIINVLQGDAAEELIRASQDADMLVVGSRGSGGFARLLLGSVSSQVTHHASCPVLVIPGPRRAS